MVAAAQREDCAVRPCPANPSTLNEPKREQVEKPESLKSAGIVYGHAGRFGTWSVSQRHTMEVQRVIGGVSGPWIVAGFWIPVVP